MSKSKLKVYLVYSAEVCEDEDTCGCHYTHPGSLQGIYLNKEKAEAKAQEYYQGEVKELEVIE